MPRFFRAWAATRPDHSNPKMRGRRYAIPFQRVWSTALGLLFNGDPRWTLVHADDERGLIRAEARTRLLKFADDFEVHVGLDVDGQTRVDVTSRSRKGKWDLGTNGRRIRRYLRDLDRALNVRPELVLPPEDGQPVRLPE